MKCCKIVEESVTEVDKFNRRSWKITFTITKPPEGENIEGWVKQAVQEVFDYIKSLVQPDDTINIAFHEKGFHFDPYNCIPYKKSCLITFENVWHIIQPILKIDGWDELHSDTPVLDNLEDLYSRPHMLEVTQVATPKDIQPPERPEIHKCIDCGNHYNQNYSHWCRKTYCMICRRQINTEGHLCYMTPINGNKWKSNDPIFVFYDLETRRATSQDNPEIILQQPCLCVSQSCCAKCYNGDKNKCGNCGGIDEKIFKDDCIKEFFSYLQELEERKFDKIIVIAHNGKAFDHQFVLNYIITKTSITPELLLIGNKILKMEIGKIVFIDSLSYFDMPLEDFPKTFGLALEVKKGYFPHSFNTEDNKDYIGPLPDRKYYEPEEMKPKKQEKFNKWYEEAISSDFVFDFQKELLEYCKNDVSILREACMKFRDLFQEKCDIDLFTETLTIAHACFTFYRKKCLNNSTFGILPRHGYRKGNALAIQWLLWQENTKRIKIQFGAKRREMKKANIDVDGFHEESNTVFLFHNCYYNGCPSCFSTERTKPLNDNSNLNLDLRYEKLKDTVKKLRKSNYNVEEMWECEFMSLLKKRPEMDSLKNHPTLKYTPLNPRDAYYGGRTDNNTLSYVVKQGEKIKYVDVCSLYPWVCKYGKFPIEHPEVFVGDECLELIEAGIDKIDGLIKCTILPPQTLYHPVLPFKANDLLTFSLCRTCANEFNQKTCEHTDEERALSGTWVIDEVTKAIQKGYQLVDVQEIWRYQVTQYDRASESGGLFVGFVNYFLKMKQQASGWPTDCVTDEQKKKYIDEYRENEGIELDWHEIEENPGLRCLAKRMLNSFYGKLSEKGNYPNYVITADPAQFYSKINHPSSQVNYVKQLNEDRFLVNWKYKDEAANRAVSNGIYGAYVTAQGRQKLYSYLEQLGERVLYYDTDSVFYVSRENEPDLPLGNFLGCLTDEVESEFASGSYIREFVCAGLKRYAYEVFSPSTGKTHEKVVASGFTLNCENLKKINLDSIKKLVENKEQKITITTRTTFRITKMHEVVLQPLTRSYKVNVRKRKLEGSRTVPYGYKKKIKL